MVRGINRARVLRFTGIGMLVFGLVLIIGFGSLYITGLISQSRLETLNAELVDKSRSPLKGPRVVANIPTTVTTSITKNITTVQEKKEIITDAPIKRGESTEQNKSLQKSSSLTIAAEHLPDPNASVMVEIQNSSRPTKDFNELIAGYSSLKLGTSFHPKDWANPMWAEADTFSPYQIKGFLHNRENELLVGPALSIQIPLIGIDSKIKDLSIVEQNDGRSYETPKNVVGRISTNEEFEKSVPGWFFGHLESPIKGEGNVFHNLPEVAEHLRNGDPVYVHIKNHKRDFVYLVNKSQVIHKSDLQLYDLGIDSIMLVTCANRPYYDHRQLVSARLIDIR